MQKPLALLFSLALCLFSSCVSHQELINFRSGKEKDPSLSKLTKQDISNQLDSRLQRGDVLAIIVTSPDGLLSAPYNLAPTQLNFQGITPTSPITYLIGSDGTINIPSLGGFKVLGLTIKEVQEEILKKVSRYLENPSVNVRLINFRISVSGEVAQPGSFVIENERITVLEALTRAGDLTPFSNREHIMIIREINGVREQGEINLKDKNFFTSPYYYLQQNDLVYVEPTKHKRWQIQQSTNSFLAPIGTAISLLTTLILIFKK
jgi:polysaccharide biosynthesis/export protein